MPEEMLARRREQHRQSDQKYRAARQEKVNAEEGELCRKDVRRAAHKDFVVCLECLEKHGALQRHLFRHKMTAQEYLKRWPGAPLIASSVLGKISERHAGKPRFGTRKKDSPDDATIVELRLEGKTMEQIAAQFGMTHGVALKRLRYLGFPSTAHHGASRFLHGEPVARRHFDDLFTDFHVTAKEVVTAAGPNPVYEVNRPTSCGGFKRRGYPGTATRYYYDIVVTHLADHKPEDILPSRFADLL